jgi:hypothetical protein
MAVLNSKFKGRNVVQPTSVIPARPFERANPLVAFIPEQFHDHGRKMPRSRRKDKGI